MQGKDTRFRSGGVDFQAAVMRQAETKSSGNGVNRTRSQQSRSMWMKRGSGRGGRSDSDHFEDVQQLLTLRGDILMTADKVKHLARAVHGSRRGRVGAIRQQRPGRQSRQKIMRFRFSLAAYD